MGVCVWRGGERGGGGACWKTAMVVKAYVGFSGTSPICDGISRKGVLYRGKSVYNLSFGN